MSIKVSGTEVTLEAVEKLIPSGTSVDDALRAGAEIIAVQMRLNAPVLSGDLKAAIQVGNPKNSKTGTKITVGVHRRHFKGEDYYPAFVEYGHGGPSPAAPHPYIRPAYDLKKDEAWAAVKQHVIDEMNTKGL